MIGALNSALSGLGAAAYGAAVTANNIANLTTTGRPGAAAAGATGEGAAYQAQSAVNVNGAGGQGVQAQARLVSPPTLLRYDPTSSFANENGEVETPNVDLAEQATNLISADSAYKANLASFRTADDMLKQLIDQKA